MRKTREEILQPIGFARATVRLYRLQGSWIEMQPTQSVRALAETLLHQYPLRTADAYQLASAMRWRGGSGSGAGFVCMDHRLREAAEAEGFDALPYDPA